METNKKTFEEMLPGYYRGPAGLRISHRRARTSGGQLPGYDVWGPGRECRFCRTLREAKTFSLVAAALGSLFGSAS